MSEIKILSPIEHIRTRPGMYVGDTSDATPILHELVDNAIDEALNGYATEIEVEVHSDYVRVKDNGRGMPLDIHPEGNPYAKLVFKIPFSGGKFTNNIYKYSTGLHGVGLTVVYALSKRLELRTARDGKLYIWKVENGEEFETWQDYDGESFTEVIAYPDSRYFRQMHFRTDIVAEKLSLLKTLKQVSIKTNFELKSPLPKKSQTYN